MSSKNVPYLIVTPGFILLVVFLVLPLISVIWPTFYDGAFTLESYFSFFMDSYNRTILWRTIKISLLVTLVTVIFGLPTAYFIARNNRKWRSLMMGLVLFPLLTNSVVRSFAWINILGTNGIINRFLLSVGWISEPIRMLYSEFAITVGSVYLFLPLMITTLVGILENIDTEIVEAAETLGASPLTAFVKVIWPLSIPGVIVGSILVFTGTLTAYTTPQLLGGNQNMMMSTFLYQNAMTLGNWQDAGVIALIMIVTTVLVMNLFNWIATRVDRRGGDIHA
ncbi:ABC transporter permease [Jeotgalibaca ciconiae]|uniref:ABC transporter permease n=1 Tax=Jeotgalibaca ciconiae TaxID=2496265 RepID=A0A3S9HAG0_9LACT|nr:ABC transporter permease [Jeotgalibaca ciconiae]AZP04348.1 ABC transporter permease [Jeotgalibaca ciconiae]HJB23519.1 ABC transporter permease [Candidatus Jeotgalibaca pullicola]